MDDHPHSPSAAGGTGHNGWYAGQSIALRRGALAGLRGRLVSCTRPCRWIVSLDPWQPGAFLSVDAESLTRVEDVAAESPSPAESSLPLLKPESAGTDPE
jgi:hypothetical protein